MITLPREIKTQEHLLVWFMGYFSRSFKNNVIIKGGMVLRLMECPRYTNDLDVLFVPFKSKKEILPKVQKLIEEIQDLQSTFNMDSMCLRCILKYRDISVQIEATVSEFCQSEAMSTAPLLRGTTLQPHLISVQKREVALAHKLAAWNERNLYRDLYDIYFYVTVLNVSPDMNTLNDRLKRVLKGRVNVPKEMCLQDLVLNLKACRDELNQDKLEIELKPILDDFELAGLDMRIKASLAKLEQLLSNV